MTQSVPSSDRKYLLYLVAKDSYFLSHRLPMARAAQQAGYNVIVAAPEGDAHQQIEAAGFKFIALKHFSRSGLSLFKEIKALYEIIKVYRKLRPTIVHHVAMKPVLYGSIAALFQPRLIVVNALGGLGYIFISTTVKARLIRCVVTNLFEYLFARQKTILILQNQDDQRNLVNSDIVKIAKTIIIPGSGVDINLYKSTPLPGYESSGPIIAYVGRMLIDKGINELVQASQILKDRNVKVKFYLYGDVDLENPASITAMQMRAWHDQGLINWYGPVQNAVAAYQNCHIAILPSYREGLPKSLLEAASCGRPVIATDVPGCRDVVIDNMTGLLVPVKSAIGLANAIQTLVNNQDLCQEMGQQGYLHIKEKFTDELITQATTQLYQQLKELP